MRVAWHQWARLLAKCSPADPPAVHLSRVDDVLAQTGSLARKTVLTCSLPMTRNDSRMVLGLTTSGAETLAARLRKAHMVSAFSTAPSEVLFSVSRPR